jgi:hypothetical protein
VKEVKQQKGKQHAPSMPSMGATQREGRNQPASKPMSGASDRPAHKHPDKMVALGEGLAMGSVHSAHTKMPVRQAKHNHGVKAVAHAMRDRAIAGNAGTMGEGSVTNQKTGPGGSLQENPGVRSKARMLNVRSEMGHANPTAMPDSSGE